jgi:hypothetical protein
MKKVFSDISQVAHLWANQLQDEARNSGNFYFNGKTIYSYGGHFPIAKHITNERGENAVLFTTRGYSNTTARHIAVTRQAANHLNVIKCYNPNTIHAENFNSWKVNAELVAAKLPKAKKPEKYLNELDAISREANKYADFFGVEIPAILGAILSIKDKNEYTAYHDQKTAILEAERLKNEAELKKQHKKALTEWKAGKTSRLYVRIETDYLRVNQQAARIETTQAVQIPMELAKRLFYSIKENTLNVGDKVLNFEVNEVGAKIKIGCHTFTKKYLLQFGSKVFAN